MELAIAEGLHELGWTVVGAYEHEGDLLARWNAVGRTRRFDPDSPASAEQLANAVSDADVLYVHSLGELDIAMKTADLLGGRPVVSHLHLPPFHLRTGWKRIKGRLREQLDPELYSRRSKVDLFIAVSSSLARRWVQSGLPRSRGRRGPERCEPGTIPHAPPQERASARASLGLQPEDIALGYVGRIDRLKGIEQLLAAFATVRRTSHAPLRLFVAGSATRHERAEFDSYLGRLKAHAHPDVVWLGKRDDTASLYWAMGSLVVVPSQWEEPFGLVAAEALVSGALPLVARRGGLPEVVGPELRHLTVVPTARRLSSEIGKAHERS